MIEWNIERLNEMTQMTPEFTKTNINFNYLAENLEEIVTTLHNNGDVLPLQFEDVKVACQNDPFKQIDLPEISESLQQQINEKQQKQKLINIKHISRAISHEEWFDFVDEEVLEFVKKYPQFKDVLIQ